MTSDQFFLRVLQERKKQWDRARDPNASTIVLVFSAIRQRPKRSIQHFDVVVAQMTKKDKFRCLDASRKSPGECIEVIVVQTRNTFASLGMTEKAGHHLQCQSNDERH